MLSLEISISTFSTYVLTVIPLRRLNLSSLFLLSLSLALEGSNEEDGEAEHLSGSSAVKPTRVTTHPDKNQLGKQIDSNDCSITKSTLQQKRGNAKNANLAISCQQRKLPDLQYTCGEKKLMRLQENFRSSNIPSMSNQQFMFTMRLQCQLCNACEML